MGIIDYEFKYFKGPEINTIITFFKHKSNSKNSNIKFITIKERLKNNNSYINKQESKHLKINNFSSNDQTLNQYKWGMIYNLDKEIIQLLELMNKKNDDELGKKFKIGQGLNIGKDKILFEKKSNSVPIFMSVNGSPYVWKEKKCFIDKKYIQDNREIPVLILPRGVGTHFCCVNNTGGYSFSYVEIYKNSDCLDIDILRLWLFCNSSLLWLLREYSGRRNLGGGMLKAEATDLKDIPLYFNFPNTDKIQQLFDRANDCFISKNIYDTINSEIHMEIDKIVLSYFGIKNRNLIIKNLENSIKQRLQKSKT